MKLAYIANIRLPTEKAHGYQIMRVCSEWARMGHSVTLFVPMRNNPITVDAFEYYGVPRHFAIEYVPCKNWMSMVRVFGRMAFFAQSLSFLRAAVAHIPEGSVVYTRDLEAVWYLSRQGLSCIYNAHNWPRKSALAARLIASAKGVVCNSKGTQSVVQAAAKLPTVVAYNASDSNPYAGQDKQQLRKELGLPPDTNIALYSGHLYGWKGADTLLQCARLCEQHPQCLFVAIGGTKEDIQRLQEETIGMRNISFLGHQPKSMVPKFLAAADVLLLPNTRTTAESVSFTSPLKMFEYMASGTPIVASDLPSLREILSDDVAYFSEAGNAKSLADSVARVLAHPDEAAQKARAALAASTHYTWDAHAKSVIVFIQSVTA